MSQRVHIKLMNMYVSCQTLSLLFLSLNRRYLENTPIYNLFWVF